jgi:hypothetical protein
MAITLKRQLSEDEKLVVLGRHGMKCFANGHAIPDGEQVQYDHIRAYALGGPSELSNIAPMCAVHNREKGVLSLFDFRTKLKLEEFFSTGDKLTLKQLLGYMKKIGDIGGFGESISIQKNDGSVAIESAHFRQTTRCYQCPTTGWNYFYATLPVSLIDSDDDDDDQVGLQPRYLIMEKVFDLFRHFQSHPVLQPSVGRVVGNRIRLFDGQHKAAALLWNGRKDFECKIYLEADLRLLNQTNIAAHDKYAQTRFFSSIMVLKLGSQFGADFNEYKNSEEDPTKSEFGFMKWLRKQDPTQTGGQLNERFRSFLYNSVLEDPRNRLARLVSAGNRGTDERPITMDMLSKSLFAAFLFREPTQDSLASEGYKRGLELDNVVAIFNALDDAAFHAWETKPSSTNDGQRSLKRMLRSKSMMAWAELLRDAVCAKLDIHDGDDKSRCLYRELSQAQLSQVRQVVNRLVGWPRWSSPDGDDVDRVLADNKSEVKSWFKSHGFTTGYLLGASE